MIDFTQSYTQPDPSAYLAMSPDADITSGVLAAQTGTIQASHIASTGATLVEFATPEETIAAVRNGEADAVLADKGYLPRSRTKTRNWSCLKRPKCSAVASAWVSAKATVS